MKKVKPLRKSALKEIRSILEKFKTGKVPHNQEYFFCGTARCLAGEKLLEDVARYYKDRSLLTKDIRLSNLAGNGAYQLSSILGVRVYPVVNEVFDNSTEEGPDRSFWHYARLAWGLNIYEARKLFAMSVTLDDQFDVLEKLENGLRYHPALGWATAKDYNKYEEEIRETFQ